MEDIEPPVVSQDRPASRSGYRWQILWFVLHLAAVYAIVQFITPWLSWWTRRILLPLLQQPTSSGRFEFLFSHVLVFSLVPAILSGLINARFKHKAAQFVWVVPAVVLAYKFATFPSASVLESRFPAAFHQYFEGGFLIPEYRNWQEFWSLVGSSADMTRGMVQMNYTAPFYAGIGYSIAAWFGARVDLSRRIVEKVRSWKQSRFR